MSFDNQLTELERLAKAATLGPWTNITKAGKPCKTVRSLGERSGYLEKSTRLTETSALDKIIIFSLNDASFIAAASPDVILKLIRKLRVAKEVLDQIACRHEGDTVDGTFDCPGNAETARQALAEMEAE